MLACSPANAAVNASWPAGANSLLGLGAWTRGARELVIDHAHKRFDRLGAGQEAAIDEKRGRPGDAELGSFSCISFSPPACGAARDTGVEFFDVEPDLLRVALQVFGRPSFGDWANNTSWYSQNFPPRCAQRAASAAPRASG